MPTELKDPFHLSSGLMDDIDLTFEEATFGFDPAYNDAETCVLKVTVSSDDPDFDEENNVLLYPCGGFEPTDKTGRHAQHESGKPKPFNKNSGIGLLIGAMMDTDAADVLQARWKEDDLSPFDAELYEGLSFHMKQKTINYGGEIGEKDRLLPEEFLGVVEGESKKPAKKAKKTAKKSRTARKPARKAPRKAKKAKPEVSEEIIEAITDIATEVVENDGDHETFTEACYEDIEFGDEEDAASELIEADDEDSIWGWALAAAEDKGEE